MNVFEPVVAYEPVTSSNDWILVVLLEIFPSSVVNLLSKEEDKLFRLVSSVVILASKEADNSLSDEVVAKEPVAACISFISVATEEEKSLNEEVVTNEPVAPLNESICDCREPVSVSNDCTLLSFDSVYALNEEVDNKEPVAKSNSAISFSNVFISFATDDENELKDEVVTVEPFNSISAKPAATLTVSPPLKFKVVATPSAEPSS